MFKFSISTNLRFGLEESQKLGDVIEDYGFLKIAAIIDDKVCREPQVEKMLKTAGDKFPSLKVFKNKFIEPTYKELESFRKNFNKISCHCLVAIGGGSTIDLAKGIAVLLTNKGRALSFRGFPKLKNKPLPLIAIPTTAGSGSEATYNAVFTDDEEKRRLGINSVYNFPACAIVDPLLTLSCPESATVSSGLDALTHSLESFLNRNHTPLSRMYSKEAFRMVFNNLSKVLAEPDNLDVRSGLALGAYLAGVALVNSGAGVAGAFSYPLGAVYKIAHGLGGAIFLPAVTRINIDKGFSEYAELYDLIEGTNIKLTRKEKNAAFLKEMEELSIKMNVPKRLGYFGLNRKDMDFLANQYDLLRPAIDLNPLEINRQDIVKMINELA